jgi:RNA polymerase sigma factor (sigma-70 family)
VVRKRIDEIMRTPSKREYWLRRAGHIVGRYAEPEDVLGRCCARALISGHTYDIRRDFDAWFATIVRTVSWRMCGKHSTIIKHEVQIIPEERINIEPEDLPDEEFDPDNSVRWQQIQTALGEIPEEQRALLIDHYLNGKGLGDMAALHGRTKTAMTIRLQRARAALRNALGHHRDN